MTGPGFLFVKRYDALAERVLGLKKDGNDREFDVGPFRAINPAGFPP
jgi:hypothetical protein